jgi:hypothetical protein
MPLNLKPAREDETVKAELQIARRIADELQKCDATVNECRQQLHDLTNLPAAKTDRDRAIEVLDGGKPTTNRSEIVERMQAALQRHETLKRAVPDQNVRIDEATTTASYRAARQVFPDFHKAMLEVDASSAKLLQQVGKYNAMRSEFEAAGYNATQLPSLLITESVRERLGRVRAEFEADAIGLGHKLPSKAA